MSRLPRFGTALSALALAGAIAGCAGPMSRQSKAINLNNTNVGLAMRAQLALAGGQFSTAVDLAEQAVEKSPDDASMRALLGNVYFGAGRFASAEAAYRDAVALSPNEPQVILKLSLVQIAQGKSAEALAVLNAAQAVLDPADYGLALALAGEPAQAVQVLGIAARASGADARVRQNLALAHGLAGDWLASRTIAAQDLTPDLVDQRVHQWMAMAKPVRPSDQVAALVGVTPAQSDPGQPVRLALKGSEERFAQLIGPQPVPQSSQPVPAPEMTAFVMPPAGEQATAVAEYLPPPMAAAFEAPKVEEVVASQTAAPPLVEPAPPPPLVAALSPSVEAPKPIKAQLVSKPRSGNSGLVVQIGAYSSADRVELAWEQAAGRHASLNNYTPTSARFQSAKGTVYRLAVKGFSSFSEAKALCSSLRSQGKACFIRNTAGDTPVQFASR